MKKILIFILVILFIIAGYYFVSPFFINKKVSESLPINQINNSEFNVSSENLNINENISVEVKTNNDLIEFKNGQFTGFDKIHTGSGTVRFISTGGKNYIRFEDDFNVTNGPDLYVGLGKNGEYIKASELAKLKGNIGAQNYELPTSVNLDDVSEVWIWCRAFSVPFSRAVLE